MRRFACIRFAPVGSTNCIACSLNAPVRQRVMQQVRRCVTHHAEEKQPARFEKFPGPCPVEPPRCTTA